MYLVGDRPLVLAGDGDWGFWFVELDDFEPLVVSAWPGPSVEPGSVCPESGQPPVAALCLSASADEWLEDVTAFLETVEIGEPAPAAEGGTARLSTFGTAG